jgi:putative membrane protein
LLALLLIVIVVAVVIAVARALGPSRAGLPPATRSRGLEVLDERYARGEISRDEYLQKRRDLES